MGWFLGKDCGIIATCAGWGVQLAMGALLGWVIAVVGGRVGIGAAASYYQRPRKRSFGAAKSAVTPIPALLASGG